MTLLTLWFCQAEASPVIGTAFWSSQRFTSLATHPVGQEKGSPQSNGLQKGEQKFKHIKMRTFAVKYYRNSKLSRRVIKNRKSLNLPFFKKSAMNVPIFYTESKSLIRPPALYSLECRAKPVRIWFAFGQMKTRSVQFCYVINPICGLFHLQNKVMSPERYLL